MTERTPDFMNCYPETYGRHRTMRPEYFRCCSSVPAKDGWGSSQCTRANGHGPHGAYCKQHDPAARKTKSDAWDAERKAERDIAARHRQHTVDCEAAIREIAAGHSDPRGLAQALIDKRDAGN